MTEHTKEPWRADGGDVLAAQETVATTYIAIGELTKAQRHSNASRIVACVNALAHISTEQLESGELLNLGLEIKDLRKQNDELLAELERVKEICLRELGIGIVNEVVLAKARGDK